MTETTDETMELWADARRDVDLEMAAMAAVGDAIAAARNAGRCAHQSAVGYLSPPCYPEQEGLRPGQLRCTDPFPGGAPEGWRGCGAVFDGDDDWDNAMNDAICGDIHPLTSTTTPVVETCGECGRPSTTPNTLPAALRTTGKPQCAACDLFDRL
jgi:hypothetical protein